VKALDVVAETGVSYRQLDYWTRCGFLHASHLVSAERGQTTRDVDGGSGSHRQYTGSEVAVIKAMVALCRLGLDPRKAAPIARRAVDDGMPLKDALAEALQAVAS
jgi:DNA-binding transcriptional MerR regulator